MEEDRKRRAVGATSQELEKMVETIGRQVLANTQEQRMIAPALYQVALMKQSNPYFQQADQYLKMYSANVKKGGAEATAAGEPWWWVMAGLVYAGTQDSKLPLQEKKTCEGVWEELRAGPKEVARYVNICRMKKACGEGNKKLIIGHTQEGKLLVGAILTGVVLNGGRVAQGQAPRGVNERLIQDWLEGKPSTM